MKPLKLIVTGLAIVFASALQAQVSLNINVGTAPVWGPEVEPDVRYYYLPDVNAYYDIHTAMFIYANDGRWTRKHHLPNKFRNYDLYSGRKVVVYNYRGNSPYTYCNYRPNRYAAVRPQRENYEEREHNERYSHDNFHPGNGRGHGHGNGKGRDW